MSNNPSNERCPKCGAPDYRECLCSPDEQWASNGRKPVERYRLADMGGGTMRMQSVANPAWHSTHDGEWVRYEDYVRVLGELSAARLAPETECDPGTMTDEELIRATSREKDPELQRAVEHFLWKANDRKYCPVCTKPRGKPHSGGCGIAALNRLLNSRVPRRAEKSNPEPQRTCEKHGVILAFIDDECWECAKEIGAHDR